MEGSKSSSSQTPRGSIALNGGVCPAWTPQLPAPATLISFASERPGLSALATDCTRFLQPLLLAPGTHCPPPAAPPAIPVLGSPVHSSANALNCSPPASPALGSPPSALLLSHSPNPPHCPSLLKYKVFHAWATPAQRLMMTLTNWLPS